MSQKILFLSRDPGGTNQLVALRHILLGPACDTRAMLFDYLGLSQSPQITVMAKDYAHQIWQQNNIAADPVPDFLAEKYLVDFDQIITGTSHVDDRTEQELWQTARVLGIPITAFLDSADNMDLRFTGDLGEVILPDRVSIIDMTAVPELVSLGFDLDNIFVSGNLYLDHISAKKTAQNRSDGFCRILFASDYIREMQAKGVFFEVTEFEALGCLLELLKSGDISRYITDARPPYRLIIRPHPKDTPGKYDGYPGQSTPEMKIVIAEDGPASDAVMSSHIVAGLGSSLLAEARVLGVDVLELEPIVKNRTGR